MAGELNGQSRTAARRQGHLALAHLNRERI